MVWIVRSNDENEFESAFMLCAFKKSNLNFHGGKLCVNAPVHRLLPAKTATGAGAPPCTGLPKRDYNATIQNGNDPLLTPGKTVFAQWLQRDPAGPAGFGDSSTDGLGFTSAP